MRHLAIGDIHGCFQALTTLIDYVRPSDNDVVITLGDYVDRGPNTAAVLDWLINYQTTRKLVALRGNHEIMMLAARDGEEPDDWLEVGGKETLASYSPFGDGKRPVDVPESHWRFLESTISWYETERHFFVHANAYPDIPLDEQPDFMLYWEKFDDPPRHDSGKIMVCGHTSQKSGIPAANDNAICIDTWAHGRGWLTCLDVESGRMWQANENGDTRSLHLDELQTGHEI